MGETLMQRRRVSDEALRGVKLFRQGRIMTVPAEAAAANYVPAAAVIRRQRALSGVTGRKGCVGGPLSFGVKSPGLTGRVRRKLED